MILEFFNKKKTAGDLYLGLLMKEKEGVALIFARKNGKMQILGKEKIIYSNGWENLTEDIDEILFKLEKNLQVTIEQVIFFLYTPLLNEQGTEIKSFYLNKIKEIVKNLELSPLGYIECYEAIYSYLSEKEEVSLTAILVELDVNHLSFFIYKGGKLSYRKVIPRSENLVKDLSAGFSDLKGKFLLPSRIILYNSKDLDEASTKILTHRWSEDYFVQLPKVEVLKEEEVIEASIYVFEKEKNLKNDHSTVGKKEKRSKEILGFIIGADISEEKEMFQPPSFKLSLFVGKIWEKLRKITFPKISIYQNFLILIGFLLILSGLIINEIFFHKATLTVFVPSLVIEKPAALEVSFKIATVSGEFTQSKSTTGRREVGEKASGEVIIYNTNLNKERWFKKGTIIEFEGLKFTFNEEVRVPTASAATTPGVAKVKVTAMEIGSEYNLSKGKRFNIDETSYAQSVSDFAGGLKKELRTIAQKDIDDLKSTVIEKAKREVKLLSGASDKEILIPEFSTVKLKEVKTSGEVGEEAATVTLKAKVESTYYYYQKERLLAKLVENITSQIPAGFELSKREKISYKTNLVTKKGEKVLLNLSFKAKALKKISKEEILKEVAGRHKRAINNILQKKFKVQGYDINIKGTLPVIKEYLPFISSNITLIISNL